MDNGDVAVDFYHRYKVRACFYKWEKSAYFSEILCVGHMNI